MSAEIHRRVAGYPIRMRRPGPLPLVADADQYVGIGPTPRSTIHRSNQAEGASRDIGGTLSDQPDVAGDDLGVQVRVSGVQPQVLCEAGGHFKIHAAILLDSRNSGVIAAIGTLGLLDDVLQTDSENGDSAAEIAVSWRILEAGLPLCALGRRREESVGLRVVAELRLKGLRIADIGREAT